MDHRAPRPDRRTPRFLTVPVVPMAHSYPTEAEQDIPPGERLGFGFGLDFAPFLPYASSCPERVLLSLNGSRSAAPRTRQEAHRARAALAG